MSKWGSEEDGYLRYRFVPAIDLMKIDKTVVQGPLAWLGGTGKICVE